MAQKERTVKASTMLGLAALTAACVLGAAAIQAQDKGASPAVGAKVGVINVRQAIIATAEGKLASAELQSQFASRQTELQNLNKQIEDIRQRLQAGERVLSEDEKARLTSQGQRLATQLERKQNEYQEDVNAAQAEIIDRIGRKMMDVLDRYCRENAYIAVFNSSPENSPLLYSSPTIDVTQDIIRLYDQAYPVKSAGATAPAAKPATPKQATPPPTQQKPPQR
ncbi:MAG: hypothetical protein AUG07_02945 [Acidobacteria bacterium 13_1_20CM_2_60_10]|nr:MAG: hypothetical protein AUG07_02945 [Acidobacteria bacterium 13_1_20CM_2_60_10]